jgi:hypothetical protein
MCCVLDTRLEKGSEGNVGHSPHLDRRRRGDPLDQPNRSVLAMLDRQMPDDGVSSRRGVRVEGRGEEIESGNHGGGGDGGARKGSTARSRSWTGMYPRSKLVGGTSVTPLRWSRRSRILLNREDVWEKWKDVWIDGKPAAGCRSFEKSNHNCGVPAIRLYEHGQQRHQRARPRQQRASLRVVFLLHLFAASTSTPSPTPSP